MHSQIPMSREDVDERKNDDGTFGLTDDLAYLKLSIVNVSFIGKPGAADGWVLVDTGLPTSASSIVEAAERRFGAGARPRYIVMTHGHVDHAGCVERLAADWDVPVYAHVLEHPYLDGSAAYPPADPLVGGGTFPLLSPLLPRSPVNLGHRLQPLPEDGSLPHLPGWTWLHTPGHTPGHISLWRAGDRLLLSGDAVITTGQESVYEILTQRPELHGPPRYLTTDWEASAASAAKLAGLEPEWLQSGHGPALRGQAMRDGLKRLAEGFEDIAVPKHGHYREHPARAEDGTAYAKP